MFVLKEPVREKLGKRAAFSLTILEQEPMILVTEKKNASFVQYRFACGKRLYGFNAFGEFTF